MQDLIKSFNSLTLALGLFGLKQGENIFYSADRADRRNQATASMDSLAAATIQQLGGTLRATYDALDNLQRGMIAFTANILWPTGGQSRGRRDNNHVTETFDDSEVRQATDWPFDNRTENRAGEPRTRVAPNEYVHRGPGRVH